MRKTHHPSSTKAFVKQTARQTWSTALLVAFLLGGVALAVSSFSGPPAGCTPASCPANPLRIDFTNGIVNAKKLQLNDQVVPGSACSSTGLVATNTGGDLLSCKSGVWTNAGGNASGGYTQNQLGKARTSEGTLTCGTSYPYPTSSSAHYGYYTSTGQPYVRVVGSFGLGSCDSGWVNAASVKMTQDSCGGNWGAYGSFSMSSSINATGGLSGIWSMPGFNGEFNCSKSWTKVYSILYGLEN